MARTKYELVYYYQNEIVKETTTTFDDETSDPQNEVNKIGEISQKANLTKTLLGVENWDTVSLKHNDIYYYYYKS